MATSLRERYPGPWTFEQIPSGYRVLAKCGTAVSYVYVYAEEWESVATTGARKLTWAEGLAMAKAIAALGD